MKIQLGLALCRNDKLRYTELFKLLEDCTVNPFNPDYVIAVQRNDRGTLSLLNFTLKACVIADSVTETRKVISFAKLYNYKVHIDLESVCHIVKQILPGKPMHNNYEIVKLLIANEVSYHEVAYRK